jgi:hypothetical protein
MAPQLPISNQEVVAITSTTRISEAAATRSFHGGAFGMTTP